MEAHTDTVNGLRADIDRYGLVSFIQGLWDGITESNVPSLRLPSRCRGENFYISRQYTNHCGTPSDFSAKSINFVTIFCVLSQILKAVDAVDSACYCVFIQIQAEWEGIAMVTARIEKIRQNYVNAKPQISCERAALWTESYKKSEGKPACIRSA